MRNLEIIRRKGCRHVKNFGDAVICAGEDSHVYICSRDEHKLVKVKPDANSPSEIICQDEVLKGVVKIQYVATTGRVFLATEEGAFLECGDCGSSELTELFKSEQKIDNFAVSPDSRIVAIVTKLRTLLVLTIPDLECLAQHDNAVDENENSLRSSIVWRKDSRYFAVNSSAKNGIEAKTDGNLWEIKIYSEDGSFHSQSALEDCQLTSSILAWQPSGGLLATYGKVPHGKAIIFFELNGLKRSHLIISQDGGNKEVLGISWNAASDVLAVRFQDCVELWVRSNYAWMLKSTIRNSGCRSNNTKFIHCFEWDAELPYRIYVAINDGSLITCDVTFNYTNGYSDGSALTVSWNGRNIYCTPFRDNSAPPPFGFLQTKLSGNVISALVSDFWDGFLAVTDSNQVDLVCREASKIRVIASFKIPSKYPVHDIDSWTWPNKSTLCCAFEGKVISFSLKIPTEFPAADVNSTEESIPELNVLHQVELNSKENIVQISTLNDNFKESSRLLAVTDCNSVYQITLENQSTTLLYKSTRSFASLRYINLSADNVALFFHDPLSRTLFMGSSATANRDLLKLSSDCTSFVTFSDNLLLSTLSGSLEIYNRNNLLSLLNEEALAETAESDKFSRKLEKGSVIVTCCINHMLEPTLILQIIPRGNLETICPRPLLISSIRMTLRESSNQQVNNKYEKIMNALRRHRLDYRVLIDEMKSIVRDSSSENVTLEGALESMIEQVKDSHSLVLLVTDLDENYEDCIKIIKDLLQKTIIEDQHNRKPNVEEAYLASLAKLGLLEEALRSRLIYGENKDERNLVTHRVKFLSYYCENPDILFDTSLGTYDLTLASLVADCLGKDPKEFLPMLDELNALSELKRKFRIDDKLRRFSKAVISLIYDESVQHSEILKYLERHRLFTDVLCCIETLLKSSQEKENSPSDSTRNQDDLESLRLETMMAYGKYLEEHTKFKEACILFRGGKAYDKAINCALRSQEWEMALEIFYCHLADSDDSQKSSYRELCDRILDALEERKDYSSAARLCEMYLIDDQKAISYWIRDRKWRRAKCLAQRNPELREKYITEAIKPKLLEAASERSEYLTSLNSEVCQHLDRLRVVKETKARKALEGDDNDTFSDTDSLSSASSSRSNASTGSWKTGSSRSGKNKRKLERRIYSMKEGSVHEDLGITAHLWTTFEKIQNSLKTDTGELVTALWEFNENDLAKTVGSALEILLAESTVAISEIWANVLPDELLEMKYRIPPVGWTSTWDKLCLHDPSSKAAKH